MSPINGFISGAISCFPRVSGDEPRRKILRHLVHRFSPRERG